VETQAMIDYEAIIEDATNNVVVPIINKSKGKGKGKEEIGVNVDTAANTAVISFMIDSMVTALKMSNTLDSMLKFLKYFEATRQLYYQSNPYPTDTDIVNNRYRTMLIDELVQELCEQILLLAPANANTNANANATEAFDKASQLTKVLIGKYYD